MKHRGPLLTLLAGAATAAVLVGLSVGASSQSAQRKAAQLRNDAAATSPSAPPESPEPVPSEGPAAEPTKGAEPTKAAEPPQGAKPPAAGAPRAYTSRVNGGGATVALVINGDKAVAYLCDGKRVEAWLSGKVAGAKLTLSGDGGAALTAEIGGGKARGSAKAAGRNYTFAAPLAKPPGGLYRVAANIRGAKVVGGWIVLADGTQIGILTRNGTPAPAPRLNPATGAATAGGDALTASPVDGTGL